MFHFRLFLGLLCLLASIGCSWAAPDIYLRGAFGGSDWPCLDEFKFTQKADGDYSLTLPRDVNGNWKIASADWGDINFGKSDEPAYNREFFVKYGVDDNIVFDMKKGDVIHLTYDAAHKDYGAHITITPAGDVSQGGNEGGNDNQFVIYFDNSNERWANPHIHYWAQGGQPTTTWPGVAMIHIDGTNIWYLNVEDWARQCMFTDGINGDGTKTDEFIASKGHLYSRAGDQGIYNGEGGNQGGGDDPVISDVKPTGTLPILYITTENIMMSKDLRDKDYRGGTYYLTDKDGNPLIGSAEDPLALEIKARGNYTRTGFSKKPFKIKLGAKQAPLGLTKSKHFALLAHADDDLGYMKNFAGFWLGKQIFPEGTFTPKEEPVELVINGDYRGLYFLTESIRVGDDRIMIEELKDNVDDPALVSGGYVVELDNYDEEGQITMTDKGSTIPNDKLRITPDTPEEYSELQRRFVTDQFTTMNDLIGAHSEDLWKYMDQDMAVRYYLVMEILNHWEAYHGSTYLFRDRGEGKKWNFGPIWDMGNALPDGGPNWIGVTGAQHYGNNWIDGMCKVTGFDEKLKETWAWFWGNKVGEFEQATKDYANSIAEAAKRDHQRWGNAPLPEMYDDPLNHYYATNPTPVCDNSDMMGKRQTAWNRLQDKIRFLKDGWHTEPAPGKAEPAWNTYEAAPLPDYAKGDTTDPDPDEGKEPEVIGMKPTGSLPVLYITTTDNKGFAKKITDYNLDDKEYRDAVYRLVDTDGTYLLGTADAGLPLEIKARGNYTRTGFSKKPFKIKLGSKQAPLGLTKSKHFALLAHADDDLGYMKNYIGFWLGQQVFPDDIFTPREVPVELVIDGDYRGLYFLTESIRIDKDRINIEELDDEVSDPALVSGGYVVELDNYEDEGQIVLNDKGSNVPNNPLRITPDTPEVYSPLQRRFVTDQFTAMNDLIGERSADLWKYMDLDMAARYYIVMEILNHWEAYHGSTYLFRDRGEGKKWNFGPIWDCGHALDDIDPNWIGEIGAQTWAGHYGNNWISGMCRVPGFDDKVKDTWKWFWGNKVSELEQDMKNYAAQIEKAAKQDHERWGNAPLPDRYNDPLNNGTQTNPTSVYNNSDIMGKRQTAWDRLQRKINFLREHWGTEVKDYPEPEWNTYEAAPLPDYADPNFKIETYKVYLKWEGKSDARIWIWDNSTPANNIASDWNHRPDMTSGIDKDGETYFVYTFTNADLANPWKLKFTSGEDETANFDFVNGALYSENGKVEDNWEPGVYTGPSHNLDTKNVTIYVCNDGNWPEPINAYIYISDNEHNKNWPGEVLAYQADLQYGNYKGLYYYVVPNEFANGKLIFSQNGNNQYPAREDADFEINGKSHIFFTGSKNYFEITPPAPPVSGTLPVLYINNVSDPNKLFVTKKKVTASFYFDAMGCQGAMGVGSAADDATYGATDSKALTCEVKGRGSSTWTDWSKKPFKLTLDKKAQFFDGIAKSKHYVLLPWCSDSELAFLRNVAGNAIAREIGLHWTPTEEPIELVIDGEYQGLYFLVESIRPSENRVNILDIDDFTKYGEAPEHWHNWIVEIDQEADDADVKHEWAFGGSQIKFVPDIDLDPTDGDMKDATYDAVRDTYIADFTADMDEFARVLNMAAADYNSEEWTRVIDPEALARFVVLNELMDDPRAFQTGCYFVRGTEDANGNALEDTRWKFGPAWDFSGAFDQKGSKLDLTFEAHETEIPLLATLWKTRVFRDYVVREYLKFTGFDFSTLRPAAQRAPSVGITSESQLAKVEAPIRAAAAKIDGALAADATRWASGADYKGVADGVTASDMADTVMSYLTTNKNYLDTAFRSDLLTGVEDIQTDSSNAPVEYFDTQGRRVMHPEQGGIYIVRRGTTATMQVVR